MLYLLLVNNIKIKHCMLIMRFHCFLTNTPEEGHYENYSYYYKKNFQICMSPANTRYSADVCLLLGQRQNRWTNIKPKLVQRHVLAGILHEKISMSLAINKLFFCQCYYPKRMSIHPHHYKEICYRRKERKILILPSFLPTKEICNPEGCFSSFACHIT